jgi:hypothetical protein
VSAWRVCKEREGRSYEGEEQQGREEARANKTKLAVILHRMWIEGTEFNWSSKGATNQPA